MNSNNSNINKIDENKKREYFIQSLTKKLNLEKEFDTFFNALSNKNKPNITCLGLYNSGKSALLNSLIDDYRDTTFIVADKRQTIENKSVEKNGYIYTDTPGLNASVSDNVVALSGIKALDINIFAHRINMPITESESEFLHKIKSEIGNVDDFLNNTIFVLTFKDQTDESTEIILKKDFDRQLELIFGQKVKHLIVVCSKSYQDGKLQDKDLLIQYSGIEVLHNIIEKIASNLELIRAKRVAYEALILQSKIDELIIEEENNTENLKKSMLKMEKELNADLELINLKINNYYTDIRSI